ncbi:uncharacterized protein LOC108214350 isoform X3 [Daucus carota subsp. sativus]|uniref:uncharacterized protein LOC108214350 isoform X3 n=1 Tax=Daucus carota subsp. sativus TaxID=79200 RepID=UPI0030837E56
MESRAFQLMENQYYILLEHSCLGSILSCILAGLLRFLLPLTKFVSLGVMFFLVWFPLIVAKPKKGLTVAVLGIRAVGLAVIAEMTNGVDRSIVWLRCCGASGSST